MTRTFTLSVSKGCPAICYFHARSWREALATRELLDPERRYFFDAVPL